MDDVDKSVVLWPVDVNFSRNNGEGGTTFVSPVMVAENIFLFSNKRPHPAYESLQRSAPFAVLTRLHATLCLLEATMQIVGGKRRKC